MNITTKTLSGAEISVAIGGQNTEIRNDGAATIYASANAGVVAGADGVVAIPAGAAVTVLDTRGRVYLLGTGEVSVVGKDTVSPVFRKAPAAGGSGEDDVARAAISAHSGNAKIHVTADEKAAWDAKANQTDLENHTGNLGIHITDSDREKIYEVDTKVDADIYHAQISGIKLDISRLGGELHYHAENANIHVTAEEKAAWDGKANLSDIPQKLQYVNYLGYVSDIDNILNNTNYSGSAYECVITTLEAAQIGLPSCWWQIKYFRHTDNNGYGIQIAFPIDGPSNLPRYRTSLGSDWNDWKLMADGGNAASVGVYTESAIAALEARIAALEGGTT